MLESVGYVGSRSSSSISKAVAAHHVSLVIQRYRSCRLMRNEVEWVHQGQPLLAPTGSSDRGVSLEIGLDSSLSPPSSSSSSTHCGLLIYISFATGANRSHAALAAETVWNLPVLTTGLWGDGVSEQHSLRALLLQGTKANPEFHYQTSITIVPQANLICKVKSLGQSIQYHGQIDKDSGVQLYAYFVDCMNAYVFTEQRRQQQQQLQDKTTTPSYTLITLPGWYTQWEKSRFTHETTKSARSSNDASQPPLIDPSIAPMRLFVGDTGYQSFDPVTGLPLTTADGQPVTKSALKKLHKQLDAHTKRHEKWQRSVAVGAEARSSTCNARTSVTDDAEPTTATAEASAATSAALKNSPEQSFADVLSVHSKDAPDSSKNEDTHGVGPFKDINWDEEIDPSFCRVVSGTFGKRQGLEFHSDMGPFCHFVRL